MRWLPFALASTGLATQPVTAAPACVTMAQAQGLIAFALPYAADAVVQRCAASLPRDAYLVRNGAALSARLRAAAPADPAGVRAAVEAISGQTMPEQLDDATIGVIAAQIVAAQVADIKPAQCEAVSQVLGLLDPLPAQNLARVIAVVLKLSRKADLPVRICEAPRR